MAEDSTINNGLHRDNFLRAVHLSRRKFVALCGAGTTLVLSGGVGRGVLAAESSESLDPNATVRVGYNSIGSLDPHRSNNASDLVVMSLVYDRLLDYSPQGQLLPGLATEWELQNDPPALILTLREGVKFHDGELFDAEVVKANLERGKGEESTLKSDLAVVQSIDVLSSIQVRLNLSEFTNELPTVLGDRPGVMVSPAALNKPGLDLNPVGTGVYRLVRYEPGVRVEFERFDDYWNPDSLAGAKRFEYIVQTDLQTRLNSIIGGQTDFGVFNNLELVDRAEAAGLRVDVAVTSGMRIFQVDKRKKPFDDVRVRQALLYAFDREGISNALYGGKVLPATQLFLRGAPGYNPDLEGKYDFDPERTSALLAEAGLTDGFEFEMVTSNDEASVRLAEVMQASLARFAINMSIKPLVYADLYQQAWINRSVTAGLLAIGGRIHPARQIGRLLTTGGSSNISGESTSEFTAAFDLLIKETDSEMIAGRAADAVAVALEQGLIVPLFYGSFAYVSQPNIENLEFYSTAVDNYSRVGKRLQ